MPPSQIRAKSFAFIATALVWGCAGVPVQQPPTGTGPDRAPTVSQAELARLSQLPNPRVTALDKSATGNGPEYVVWGKTYRVQASTADYLEEGISSWYGAKFHGRLTSSGEPFDMYKLTAAHRSLPIPRICEGHEFGQWLEHDCQNKRPRSVSEDRIIDLSFAAAVKLDFHNSGTARVRVETLTEAPPAEQALPKDNAYFLHAGRYATAEEGSASSAETNHRGPCRHRLLPGEKVDLGFVWGRSHLWRNASASRLC